jgi:PAS domain S-box-containing protein
VTDPTDYRRALDAIPHLVWTAAPDGTAEYMNRRATEYFGLPLDDLLGWDWGWVVHPSDLPATLAAWNEALRTGRGYEVEYRLRRHDGEFRWFLGRAEPSRARDGEVMRWFGTCTDVDEGRRRADAAVSNRMFFRALVERSDDGLVLVGADGTVRYANAATACLLGFTPQELTGTDMWGSVHASDRREVSEWLERVLANPGRRFGATVRFLRRGGDPCWLEVLGTNLLPDPDVRALAVSLRAVDGT